MVDETNLNSGESRRTGRPANIPRLQEEIFGFKPADNVCTVIDVDVRLAGSCLTLRGNKGLMISGLVESDIDSDGAVFVGKDAVVKGAVRCRKLIVDGSVEVPKGGDLVVQEMLGLSGRATVSASVIAYGDIEMARGCRIIGELRMVDSHKAAT